MAREKEWEQAGSVKAEAERNRAVFYNYKRGEVKDDKY